MRHPCARSWTIPPRSRRCTASATQSRWSGDAAHAVLVSARAQDAGKQARHHCTATMAGRDHHHRPDVRGRAEARLHHRVLHRAKEFGIDGPIEALQVKAQKTRVLGSRPPRMKRPSRDVVIMNAAAALYVCGNRGVLGRLAAARDAIESGAARRSSTTCEIYACSRRRASVRHPGPHPRRETARGRSEGEYRSQRCERRSMRPACRAAERAREPRRMRESRP